MEEKLSKISKLKNLLIERNIGNILEFDSLDNKKDVILYMKKLHYDDLIFELLKIAGYTNSLEKKKERDKKYRDTNKELISKWFKEYYQKHKEEIKQNRTEHIEEFREYAKKQYKKHIKYISGHRKDKRKERRFKVLSHYSPSLTCACCGESHYEFLTVDHINNDGAEHRRKVGNNIYLWLTKNNYPEGFQVLCYNCNACKGFYGECYHKNLNLKVNYLREMKKRLKVLSHYSNGEPKCACCGEDIYYFLAIDHVNGGGKKHKKEEKISMMYRYLKNNGYPEGYRILCHNCNCSLGFYDYCPHIKPVIELKYEFPAWVLYTPFDKSNTLIDIAVKHIITNMTKSTVTPLSVYKLNATIKEDFTEILA